MIGNANKWVGSFAARYGEGPYVDWQPTFEVQGYKGLNPSALPQWRGGGFNMWPHVLRAANKGTGATGAGPSGGFRLAQTIFR